MTVIDDHIIAIVWPM